MNTPLFLASSALAALATTVPLIGVTVVEETFDAPTEMTHVYPPAEGDSLVFHGEFSGWTREGKLSVTYGSGLGVRGTGGMLMTIDRPSDAFMQAVRSRVLLPITDPAYTLVEDIKRYVLSFDIKIPAGKTVDVILHPRSLTDTTLRARSDASKMVLTRLVGTGDFVHCVVPFATLNEQKVRGFLQLLRDIHINGEERLVVDIQWTLLGRSQVWVPGDTLQFDNIKLVDGR